MNIHLNTITELDIAIRLKKPQTNLLICIEHQRISNMFVNQVRFKEMQVSLFFTTTNRELESCARA